MTYGRDGLAGVDNPDFRMVNVFLTFFILSLLLSAYHFLS